MREEQTVAVAGVPVTVTVADRVLTVTTGRLDPAAAGSVLRRHPRAAPGPWGPASPTRTAIPPASRITAGSGPGSHL